MDTVRDRVDGRDPAGRAARHPARHHHRWPGRLWQRRRARLSSRSDRSRSREVPWRTGSGSTWPMLASCLSWAP